MPGEEALKHAGSVVLGLNDLVWYFQKDCQFLAVPDLVLADRFCENMNRMSSNSVGLIKDDRKG